MQLQTLLRSMFKKMPPMPPLPRKELVRVIPPPLPVVIKTKKEISVPGKCPCCQRPYST